MFLRLSVFSLAGLVLAGCSTFNDTDLAQFRAGGVPAPLVAKLSRNRPITPPEVISLTRHGIPSTRLVSYIHRNGVNYLLNHNDSVRMRQAGVAVRVIDALAEESAAFAGEYRRPAGSDIGVGFGYSDVSYLSNPYGYYW